MDLNNRRTGKDASKPHTLGLWRAYRNNYATLNRIASFHLEVVFTLRNQPLWREPLDRREPLIRKLINGKGVD